jgi:pilus assembly protein CpaB
MATIGRTLSRFGGALLLGASATAVDDPGVLFAPTAPRGVPVVIAGRDIPRGAVVDRAAVEIARWPARTIPAGAYGSIDSVAGRVTRMAVFRGEALVSGRFAPDGIAVGLEIKITPGKRAYAFPVKAVSGIADLIQPNSRVDILVVVDGGPEKRRVAKLFMENMRVLAMGKVARRDGDGRLVDSAVATIEVTPEQAERLAIAATQGDLQLLLRGYQDSDSVRTSAAVPLTRDLLLRTPWRSAPVAPLPHLVPPVRADTIRLRVFRGVRDSAQDSRDSTRRR